MPFDKELIELEEDGYVETGAFIQCPQVGGDHDLELWENENGSVAEVCRHCETVSRQG